MGRLRPICAGGGRRPGPLAAGSSGRAGALCLVSLSVGFSLLLGGDERSPCHLPASWERVSCASSFPGGPRQPRADVLLAEETAARRFVSPPEARPVFRQHAACCAELCCAVIAALRTLFSHPSRTAAAVRCITPPGQLGCRASTLPWRSQSGCEGCETRVIQDAWIVRELASAVFRWLGENAERFVGCRRWSLAQRKPVRMGQRNQRLRSSCTTKCKAELRVKLGSVVSVTMCFKK